MSRIPRWPLIRFPIAHAGEVKVVTGPSLAGIGLWTWIKGIPELSLAPTMGAYHLGTGHLLCFIHATDERMMELACELAALGDWTFDSLDGWRNQFPEASVALSAFVSKHEEVSRPEGGSENEPLALMIAGLQP